MAGFLIGLVDRVAADNGAEDARLGELGGRNFGEVVRKDDEVGVLALFQLALLPFFKLRVSGSRDVRTNAIRKRDFLLRLPPVLRTAIRAFARHASVQTTKRADRLHVVIRTEREPNAVFQHGGPSIGADDPLAPDAVLRPTHVRGL